MRVAALAPLADTVLYHATSRANWRRIQATGLALGPVYLTTSWALALYYADEAEDSAPECDCEEGCATCDDAMSIILAVPLAALDVGLLEPDLPGIEEPIATVVGLPEPVVQGLWAVSDQSWRASVAIISSLRSLHSVPASLFTVADDPR